MTAAGRSGAPTPRLLVLTPDYPPARGGIQALVHGLVTALEGFRTRVIALDGPGAAGFDAAGGVDIRRVRARGRVGARRNLALNAVALREAARFRPDLLLSAHIVASPAAAAIGRLYGAPAAQYFYANEIGDKPRLAAFAARRARASIAISSYTAELLAAVGAPAAGAWLIPPGITVPDDTGPLPAERPTILTVSRLAGAYKGHDVLVRSLGSIRDRVPDVQWVAIGDGPLRAQIEALARSCGVADCIRFLGSVEDAERDTWLRRADVFAMPSRLPPGRLAGEGFGIVFLEAGIYGKPVVAGNVGGALDAVVHEQTGLLVDPDDPAAVADAVSSLLRDPERARRMGAAGAERARGFAWPLIARRVEAVLLELLGASREAAGRERSR